MRRPKFTMLWVLLATSVLACATSGGSEEERPSSDGIAVQVRNDHQLDVVVYAVSGPQRFRLGTVTGHQEGVLQIPTGFASGVGSTLRLLLDPVGSRDQHLTQSIPARRGDRIFLEIRNPLSLSSFSVR